MYFLHSKQKLLLFGFTIFSALVTAYSEDLIKLSTQNVYVRLERNKSIHVILSEKLKEPYATLNFYADHPDVVKLYPSTIRLDTPSNETYKVNVLGSAPGHSSVVANLTNSETLIDVFFKVTVFRNGGLRTFSSVIGWIYFAAWSVSFYPQIYINFRRKSVIGLNFDFLLLNIVGFTLYSIFNLGLYCIPEIEEQYMNRYPRSLNPVLLNDIFFSVHAMIATTITITQCFLYDRGDQRVSITARGIVVAFGVFLLIAIILCFANVLIWLDFLYYCSYVKLAITLIKYVPQAYMNYKRKSTIGWSIGNIFLDFTGGTLSMLQMIVNSYNYDDWVSIFGDPTKFGLGLFSVVFDIFFIFQHYVLYRHTNYEEN